MRVSTLIGRKLSDVGVEGCLTPGGHLDIGQLHIWWGHKATNVHPWTFLTMGVTKFEDRVIGLSGSIAHRAGGFFLTPKFEGD